MQGPGEDPTGAKINGYAKIIQADKDSTRARDDVYELWRKTQ